MKASSALAKGKSRSGGQGFEIDVFIEELNREMMASSALAKLRKSGSGGQGFEIDVFTRELNRKMVASSALARFWKSVMIVKSSYRFS